MPRSILVTGGAGFIGSHVADALVARGDAVAVLDDLSNGERSNVPAAASLTVGDVRDPAAIDAACATLPRVDAICHLAGQASTFRSFDAPSWDMDVNGVGTARMIEAARRHLVPKFVFASSMTAYGHPAELPVREDAACAPVSFYGITKWAAERAVLVAASQPEPPMSAVAFRMFNVYGPRQSLTNPYQGVLGIFLGNVLRGEPIRVFGDGRQTRDFVYVEDVARAWVMAVDAAPSPPCVLNLGTGTQTSVDTLWMRAVEACGRQDWPVSYEAERPGDQRHMRADIERARDVLGWVPRVALEDGMARTARWARERGGR
jgi:UDP-glucose 4-epimerase